MFHIFSKYFSILCLCLAVVTARPLQTSDSPIVLPRQTVCRTGFGCLPFGNSGWNSFGITLPAVGDPVPHDSQSPGAEIAATVWNKDDGTAFLGINLVDGYNPPPTDSIEVRAYIGSTRIALNQNDIRSLNAGAVGTVPAKPISLARASSSRVVITIKWRVV
ncbi:hypothetical protein COCMIDRAFT_10389 [Bipolaris oryzae ATCC 44560]|uniref:Uncharacterized protein n=1 Tax=Bipolaris oryzae ATCC 44560 TaxID=930090 RepID=W6YPC9_COCMI|nr:uncharacterized protein COCMIDRAFT_10389 [Bipolaris oryzae ATCC 44560]EUC39525.1 hypothetical protein COCMIDRAFT_10389 [Bipolaris oryzae ATCC 44560]